MLSDGQPIEVRRLAFLELENNVPYLDPGLYIHVYVIDGHDQPVGYGLHDFGEIPERPDTPFSEAEPGTVLQAEWEQYNLYRAVLTHERKRSDIREEYLEACARYILEKCIASEDRARIVTPDDFEYVHRMALCPEVTEEDIAAILASTFRGSLEGQAVVGVLEEASRVGRILYTDSTLGAAIHVESWAESDSVRQPIS